MQCENFEGCRFEAGKFVPFRPATPARQITDTSSTSRVTMLQSPSSFTYAGTVGLRARRVSAFARSSNVYFLGPYTFSEDHTAGLIWLPQLNASPS